MVRRANQPSQARPNKPSRDSQKLTFLEHLYELRKRLFWVVLTLVFTTAIGLELKDQLIEVVMAPLKGGRLIYLTPGGGFSFIFTLSLYFGILLTIPVITYQIYKFLQPMLQEPSRKFITIYISTSVVLASAGASLAYFLAIPGALGFLDGVAGSAIVASLTADSYLTFVTTYMVGLAALFQLPLLIFLYDHIRPIPPGALLKSQRYGIVATTVMAGFITPSPDLMNYSIVLFPMLAAYESGVLAVYIRRKYFRKKPNVIKSSKKRVPKNPEAEALSEAKPLTDIVEEIAESNGQKPEQVDIQPVLEQVPIPVEQVPVASIPVQEVEQVPVQQAPQPVEVVPVQYAPQPIYVQDSNGQVQQVYVQQQYAAPQQVYVQQQPVSQAYYAPEPQPVPVQQQVPAPELPRGRAMDFRVSDRYKTNVHVPRRQGPQDTPGQNSDESADGLLTAQA